jgi:hypothetical protein
MPVVSIAFPAPELWDYVRARHIATNLDDAFCLNQDERSEAARDRLELRRFDQAPVIVEPKRVVGWVAADNLKGRSSVRSAMVSLDNSAIVSIESPMAHALQLLSDAWSGLHCRRPWAGWLHRA